MMDLSGHELGDDEEGEECEVCGEVIYLDADGNEEPYCHAGWCEGERRARARPRPMGSAHSRR
jgi:hypothetical protein